MKRITIVGAGVYAATLCEQLAAGEADEPLEIVIAAQNEQRLQTIASACGARVAMLRPDWRVSADTNLAQAVEGASLVVLLVRVGGLAARRYDETFPSQFGQVGDEGLGLGGIANTWRTLPVLTSIAETIRTNAPGAKVINMLAPLATTTRLLCDTGIDAVGICELPITTEEQFGGNGDLFDYAGVNHLGWFTPRSKQGERVLAAAVDAGHADREIVDRFGATTLFYYYRVFNQAAARRMNCAFKPGRAAQLQDLTDQVLSDFQQRPAELSPALTQRATPWFDRGLIPIMNALLGGPEVQGFVNTPNLFEGTRLVPQLYDRAIVEVRTTWNAHGVAPRCASTLTDEAASFVQAVSEADELAYRGSIERNPSLIQQAVARLPLDISKQNQNAIVNAVCVQDVARAA